MRRRPRPAPRRGSSTVGGAARRHGNAASRSGRGSSPTASQSPATARHARRSSGRSAMAVVSTTRVAPAANASRIASAESRPPASWSGTAIRAAIAPTASSSAGAPARAPVEVDEVDEPRAHGHEPLGDPVRAIGRRADPGRGAGPVDDRERPPSRSIAGMTCIASADRVRPSPASSRRWKLIGSEPLRISVSWKPLSEKRVAEPALLVGAQARAAASGRAGTTAGRSGGTCTTGPRPARCCAGTRCARRGSRSPPRRSARRGASGRRG